MSLTRCIAFLISVGFLAPVSAGWAARTFDENRHQVLLSAFETRMQSVCAAEGENESLARAASRLIDDVELAMLDLEGPREETERFLSRPAEVIERTRARRFSEKMEEFSGELDRIEGRLHRLRNLSPDMRPVMKAELQRRLLESLRGIRARIREAGEEYRGGGIDDHPDALRAAVRAAGEELRELTELTRKYRRVAEESRYCLWLTLGKPGRTHVFDAERWAGRIENPELVGESGTAGLGQVARSARTRIEVAADPETLAGLAAESVTSSQEGSDAGAQAVAAPERVEFPLPGESPVPEELPDVIEITPVAPR